MVGGKSMTWLISERQGSQKFTVSDEGISQGTISVVCTSDVGDSVDSLWVALKSTYPIGSNYTATSVNSGFGSIGTAPTQSWVVDGWSGARAGQQRSSTGQVYLVDINLSWAGPMKDLLSYDPSYRRDVEVMFTGTSRVSQSWIDWDGFYSGGLPSESDTDWSNVNPSNLRITGTRIDVNGRPMPKRVHQQRLTVNVYSNYDIDAASTTAYQHQGRRSNVDGTLFGVWTGSQVLFDSLEIVQVKHGFQRATYRFVCDWFNHLEQELCTFGEGNQLVPAFNGASQDLTTISRTGGADAIQVFHAEAVWRQPYKQGTWGLSDILGADVATYVSGLFS